MKDRLQLDNIEQASCYISAALHDYEHPGVNSVFLVNMNDQIALAHNDSSVLENYHLAQAFKLMTSVEGGEEKNNWAINMDREGFKRVRHIII